MFRRTSTAIVAAAVLLAVAGCTTPADGDQPPASQEPEPAPEATADEDGEPSDGEPSDDEAEEPVPVTLGEWVDVDPPSYFVTATAGMALLAVGDQDFGEIFTRDVAAYDASGAQLWLHPDVREQHNLPEAASAGDHVVLIDGNDPTPTLRGLLWEDGSEVWAQRVDEMVMCPEQVSVGQGTAEAALVQMVGEPCAGPEIPRTVAYSIEAGTGEVRGLIEATGDVVTTTAPDGSEAWYLQIDADDAQVHRLVLDSGAADHEVVAFEEQALADLLDAEVQWHSMQALSDHEVLLVGWQGLQATSVVLADLDAGTARPFPEGAPCAHATTVIDTVSQTCLAYDAELTEATVYDYDGNELWITEGSVGLSFDSEVPVRPIDVDGERAWLVSVGEDLIQARAARTGAELWVAGAGEGRGTPSAHQPGEADQVVLTIQHGSPATQMLRLHAGTGEELDRRDLHDAWVGGNDHVVAVHADEATLLAFVTD